MVPLELLKSVRFLQHLEDYHLQRIASVSELKEFPSDTMVFAEGQNSSSIYLVLQGEVALEMTAPGNGVMQIHSVGPGELLGWSPLVGPAPMTATARTVQPCRLIAINTDRLLPFFDRHPEFGLEFMRRTALALAKRLYDTRRHLLEQSHQGLPTGFETAGQR